MYKVKLAQPALMQQIKQGLTDLGSCTGQSLHKNDLCLICQRKYSGTNIPVFCSAGDNVISRLQSQHEHKRVANGVQGGPDPPQAQPVLFPMA